MNLIIHCKCAFLVFSLSILNHICCILKDTAGVQSAESFWWLNHAYTLLLFIIVYREMYIHEYNRGWKYRWILTLVESKQKYINKSVQCVCVCLKLIFLVCSAFFLSQFRNKEQPTLFVFVRNHLRLKWSWIQEMNTLISILNEYGNPVLQAKQECICFCN